MRTIILAAASVLALAAGAAHAETVNGGYVGFTYDRSDVNVTHVGGIDTNTYEGQGAASLSLGEKLGTQLDVDFSRFDFGHGIKGQTVVSPTAHLFLRDDRGLVGGFVGVENADGVTLWGVGAEGQAYLDKFTLAANVGYASTDQDQSPDFWGLNGEARWFPMDNLRVAGRAGWLRASASGEDFNAWKLGTDAEYQIAKTPVTLLAGYEYGRTDRIAGVRLSDSTFKVGVRLSFGGSLLERDRKGASLDNVSDIYGGKLGQGILAISSTALSYLNF